MRGVAGGRLPGPRAAVLARQGRSRHFFKFHWGGLGVLVSRTGADGTSLTRQGGRWRQGAMMVVAG